VFDFMSQDRIYQEMSAIVEQNKRAGQPQEPAAPAAEAPAAA
jgi:hypothetical protein